MSFTKSILNSRYFFWALLTVPSIFMIHGYLTERLYYGELMHATGEFSGRLLILTVAVTPLGLMLPNARWPLWLMQRRRYLGVATFAYALLHTLLYLDKTGNAAVVREELLAFEYWTGWLGFLIFVALAATSNWHSVSLLKSRWKKLHRLVYAAALLSFLHWIFVAFDFMPGVIHALVFAMLETIRIWKSRQNVRS
jgi:sulfoxide reductase heme-binding subunit YedZ